MVVQALAAEGLITAIDSLKTAIVDSFNFSDRAQKASLSLGMTFGDAKERLGSSMDNLRGSLDQRFTAALMTLEAGMRSNSAGVAQLINQQQLTGTATAGTAKAFASLERVMGMNNEQMNNLATELVSTGNAYGVSTDVLVQAINKLDGKMTQFNILGTEAIPGAVAGLTAQLGKPFEGRVNQIASLLFDTGADALQKQAVLGLTGFREQIQAAGDDQQAVQRILNDAIMTAGDNVRELAGGSNATFESFEAIRGIVGDSGVEFASLSEALRTSSEIQNTASRSYADTIATQKAEVFVPLQTAVSNLYTAVFPLFKVALGGITRGVEFVTEWFQKLYVKVGGLTGITDSLKNAFEATKNFLGDMLGKLGITFGDIGSVMGDLWDSIMDLIHNPMRSFKMAFYALQSAFGAIVEYIGDWVDDDLEAWGRKLKENSNDRIMELNAEIAANRRKREEQDRLDETRDWKKEFENMVAQDAEHFGIMSEKQDAAQATAEAIADNTAKPDTRSTFQTESFALLSESLDTILGLGTQRDLQSEMLEELRTANEQRAETNDKLDRGAANEPIE